MSRTAPRNVVSEDVDLGRLLAAEERLERMLADARAEAGRLLAEATTAADAQERGLDAELEKEAAALGARLTGEGAGREADIVAAAETAAARYDAIGADRVETLAEQVVGQLVAAS